MNMSFVGRLARTLRLMLFQAVIVCVLLVVVAVLLWVLFNYFWYVVIAWLFFLTLVAIFSWVEWAWEESR